MSRKMVFLAIVTAMLLLLAGCGLNKKISESITKGIIDNVAEEVNKDTGSDVEDAGDTEADTDGEDIEVNDEEENLDVSNEEESESSDNGDGEDYTFSTDEGDVTFSEDGDMAFEGENGEVMTISEDNAWPVGMAADVLPKFDKGTITYSMNLANGCMVSITGVSLDDYKNYLETVKKAGFTGDAFESTGEDASSYAAYSDEITYIYILYSAADSGLAITLTIDDGTE